MPRNRRTLAQPALNSDAIMPCLWCGAELHGTAKGVYGARFCSGAHRVAAHRWLQRTKALMDEEERQRDRLWGTTAP